MAIEIISVLIIVLISIGIVIYDKCVVLKRLEELRKEEDEINEEVKEILKDVSH